MLEVVTMMELTLKSVSIEVREIQKIKYPARLKYILEKT